MPCAAAERGSAGESGGRQQLDEQVAVASHVLEGVEHDRDRARREQVAEIDGLQPVVLGRVEAAAGEDSAEETTTQRAHTAGSAPLLDLRLK